VHKERDPDLKVRKVLRVVVEPQVHKVQVLVHKVLKEHREVLDHKELLVLKVHRVQDLVQQDRKVLKVLKVLQVEQRVHRDQQALQVNLDQLD
jgi:hypothetical protein